MRLSFRRSAFADLHAIFDYIHEHDTDAAYRVIKEILDALELLRGFPRIGRPSRRRGIRCLVIKRRPYIVAYRVGQREVEFLAIFHTSRRPIY